MANVIIIAVLALILGGAVSYIYKAKKSGKRCIGCPDGGTCGSKNNTNACNGCCGCQNEEHK
ncbi:MAG: FeoB-associated Cys-rich membrane protein [Firmicutes bacterium]|nr:FeoB-associated Cys-rich membrane protein [Bacillota bacterium]MBQ4092593.1 FeoB-associated Cys-rich membrane protein [Bacillota bacterium]